MNARLPIVLILSTIFSAISFSQYEKNAAFLYAGPTDITIGSVNGIHPNLSNQGFGNYYNGDLKQNFRIKGIPFQFVGHVSDEELRIGRPSYFRLSYDGITAKRLSNIELGELQLKNKLDLKTKKESLYGFQGQEMDDEIKGEGNSVNYSFRMHDPRVGRFFAIDPLTTKYPWYTPYSFSGNKVTSHVELEGLEEFYALDGSSLGTVGTSKLKMVVEKEVWTQYKSVATTATSTNNLVSNSKLIMEKKDLWGYISSNAKALINSDIKNKNKEYGARIFSREFTAKDGSEFKGYVAGKWVPGPEVKPGDAQAAVDLSNSTLKVGSAEVARRSTYLDINVRRTETGLLEGWKYDIGVHSHPFTGKSEDEFSKTDIGLSLKNNARYFMISTDTKKLYKFEPSIYNAITTEKFYPSEYEGEYELQTKPFDMEAVKKSTKEYDLRK